MFCPKCGEILRDTALRCPVCGASQLKKTTRVNTACDCETNARISFRPRRKESHSAPRSGGAWEGRTFKTAPSGAASGKGIPTLGEYLQLIWMFFRRCTDFRGRSTRWEFWWTYLFILLVTILLADLLTACLVWLAVMVVPFTALGVRRLHDVGKSGWWLLAKAIPMAGAVLLLVFFCLPSAPANRWGSRP